MLAAGHNFGIDGSFLQGQFEVDFVVAARHRGRRRQLLTRWKTYNHFGDTWEDEDNIVPKSKVSRYDKGVPVTCDAMWGRQRRAHERGREHGPGLPRGAGALGRAQEDGAMRSSPRTGRCSRARRAAWMNETSRGQRTKDNDNDERELEGRVSLAQW